MVDCLLYTRPLSLSDTIVLRWSTAYCTVDHCLSIRHYRPLMVYCLLYRRPLSLYETLSSSHGRLLTVQAITVSVSDTIVQWWSTVYCTGNHRLYIRHYRPLMVDCLLYTPPLSLYQTLSSSDGRLFTMVVIRWSTVYCTQDHCLYQTQSSSDGRLLIL